MEYGSKIFSWKRKGESCTHIAPFTRLAELFKIAKSEEEAEAPPSSNLQ